MTYTDAEQIADFGGAIASWNEVTISAYNFYTGFGDQSEFVDITGAKLAFEDDDGYLLFEDGTGALLLE